MSETLAIALSSFLTGVVVAIINGLFHLRMAKKVTALKQEINGRMTELIEAKVAVGKEEQKKEDNV